MWSPRPHPGCIAVAGNGRGRSAWNRVLAPILALLLAACAPPQPPPPDLVDTTPPVIAKLHKPGKVKVDPLHGLFEATANGSPAIVEYEPHPELRNTEQVPLPAIEREAEGLLDGLLVQGARP